MSENINIRSQEKTVSSDGRVALGKQVPVSQRSGEESSRLLSPWKGTSEGQARAGLLEATANMGKCAWGWKRQGARPLGGPLTSLGDFWLAARRGAGSPENPPTATCSLARTPGGQEGGTGPAEAGRGLFVTQPPRCSGCAPQGKWLRQR